MGSWWNHVNNNWSLSSPNLNKLIGLLYKLNGKLSLFAASLVDLQSVQSGVVWVILATYKIILSWMKPENRSKRIRDNKNPYSSKVGKGWRRLTRITHEGPEHWPIGKDLHLSFIWGHHHLHLVGMDGWSVDQLITSLLATPCWRDPTRSKQLSTVAILGFQFGLHHVVVSLASLTIIVF